MSGAVTTVVQAKVFTDHTGAAAHVPVLLTESGVVGPLLDYMLRLSGRSRAWQRRPATAGGGALAGQWSS